MKISRRCINGGIVIFTMVLIATHHYQEQMKSTVQRSTRGLIEDIPVIELNSTYMKPVYFGTERFHVILTFRIINSSESTNASLRMMEYIDCLKKFLNNPHVKQVHLMHDSPEMPRYIQEKAGAHSKLKLHKVKSPDMVLTLHQFAFTHLKGQMVIISDADVTLGEGFEEVYKTNLVIYNLYNVHHDEEFCEKPFQFDPTRFLDSQDNLLPPEHDRRQRLLTFGVGKRSCIGEMLAQVRIFLAMTAIVKKFDLREDSKHPLPSVDPRTYYIKKLTVAPSYKVCFVPRNHP